MKRILTSLVLVALLCGVVLGAMTYSASRFIDPTYSVYRNSGNNLLDPEYLFANEVEGYLEGTTAFPFLKFTSTDTEPGTTEGLVYYDTSEHTLKQRTNSAWVTLGSGTFTGGTISGNTALDDGTGASPSLTFTDATDETAVFSKADSGVLSLTTLAADGFNILVGNLWLGNGTPGTAAMNGEDAYIEGQLEVDGTVQLDGAVTAASTLLVTGMLTANAGLTGDGVAPVTGFTKVVEAHTEDDTLTVGESGSVHTNAGAGGTVVLTLPSAAAGLTFTVKVMAAQALRITPGAGDAIYIGASAGAAAEYWYADAAGETVTLTAVDATNWVADAYIGTWTQETP